MFDLPPVLPPVRLPEEAELAAQARRSALLADLRALADEVRKTMVQMATVNPVLLRLAEEAELVARDGEDLAPGEDAGWLDDLADDSDALDAWEYTFAEVLDTTLEVADDSDPVVADDLDLEGHGPALVTRLFLSRRDGVRITELAGALKDAATADLAAEEADRQRISRRLPETFRRAACSRAWAGDPNFFGKSAWPMISNNPDSAAIVSRLK